jgi:hypothetical protein
MYPRYSSTRVAIAPRYSSDIQAIPLRLPVTKNVNGGKVKNQKTPISLIPPVIKF